MKKNDQNIKIFKSSDKEFIFTKSVFKILLTTLILTILAILNILKFDTIILGAIVKACNAASTYSSLVLSPIIFIIAIFWFLLRDKKYPTKGKYYIEDNGYKKEMKTFWIQFAVFFGILIVLVIFNLIGFVFGIIAKVFAFILKLHKILIYVSIIYLIVTYLVQDSIAGEIAEKKGYGRFNGALFGLIPFVGLIYYMAKPKRRNVQNTTIRISYSKKEIWAKYLLFGELTILAFIVVLPVIYLVGASFTNLKSLPTTFWPTKNLFTLNNYKSLFTETKYFVWFKNTFIIALINMIGGVLFITGAGYVFARFKFKGKKIGLITILVLQVFPTFMGMVALFTLFETFGLVGHPTALTIIYVGGSIPFNLWLIKGYLQQIPKDLDESAMLDGANKLQIFTKIILPLSVPILSFVAVSMFMSPWMDYILPSYLLNILPASKSHLINATTSADDLIKEQWTLAVGLHNMISNSTNADYTTFAAGSIIIALPITVLYMVFQRFLIEGITAGATKG